MHGIAPDQQLFVAGLDLIDGVAGRVAVRRHGDHAREHFLFLRERPHPRLIGAHLLARALEIEHFLAIRALGHGRIVFPVRQFVLVADQFGILVERLPGLPVAQARGMVRMHVGQHDRVDLAGLDAGNLQHVPLPAGRRTHIRAGAGIDDGAAPLALNQEGVDAGAPPLLRPEIVADQGLALFLGDIVQHAQLAVEKAVGYGSDDDIADLAMIDAGNLLGGSLRHGGGFLWWKAGSDWRTVGKPPANRRHCFGAAIVTVSDRPSSGSPRRSRPSRPLD